MTLGSRNNCSSNFFRELVKHTIRHAVRVENSDRIEENGHAGVSRGELNHPWNVCALKRFKYSKHFVQGFVRRIRKLLTHAHDQRGISEGDDFHQFTVSCSAKRNISDLCSSSLIRRKSSEILRFAQNDKATGQNQYELRDLILRA